MKPGNRKKAFVVVTVAAGLLLQGPSASAGLMESWYMSRGRSNMEIGNYKAAIEAFEKVVESNPNNREAMRSLGIAYESQGLKDKAVGQYDRYLEKFPDDEEIAFKQAETLNWSRYSYRREDALKYYRAGLKKKDDPKARLRYADLLAEKKESSPEAIRQYERVLAREPRNARAHRGLARAYAWNGDRDRALHHERLAGRYGGSAVANADLKEGLERGREPSVSAGFLFLTQSGTSFGLTGFVIPVRGKRDFGPYATLTADAGAESFWDSRESASGAFFSVGGEYRLDPSRKIELQLGWRGLGGIGGSRNVSFKAQFEHRPGSIVIRPGFRRDLIQDSLLAYAGRETVVGGRVTGIVGAARLHQFYTDLELQAGAWNARLTPSVGWVSTAHLSANSRLGVELALETPLSEGDSSTLLVSYQTQLVTYGSDQSGFTIGATAEPLSGGYFSPSFYWFQSPQLVFRTGSSSQLQTTLLAGPSLQWVTDATSGSAFRLGAELGAKIGFPFSERMTWHTFAGFSQVATVYNRFQLGSSFVWTF